MQTINGMAADLSGNIDNVLSDNTDKVRGSAELPAETPKLVERQPDKWVINANNERVPVWLTDEDVKPWYTSKIFLTQMIALMATILAAVTGYNVSPEMQGIILTVILGITSGGNILTTLFRFFGTDKKLVRKL